MIALMIGTLVTDFISPLPYPGQLRQSEAETLILTFLFKGSSQSKIQKIGLQTWFGLFSIFLLPSS